MTAEEHQQVDPETDDELKWPVGFLIMVGLAGLYLVLRLVQMAGWAIDWLF